MNTKGLGGAIAITSCGREAGKAQALRGLMEGMRSWCQSETALCERSKRSLQDSPAEEDDKVPKSEEAENAPTRGLAYCAGSGFRVLGLGRRADCVADGGSEPNGLAMRSKLSQTCKSAANRIRSSNLPLVSLWQTLICRYRRLLRRGVQKGELSV